MDNPMLQALRSYLPQIGGNNLLQAALQAQPFPGDDASAHTAFVNRMGAVQRARDQFIKQASGGNNNTFSAGQTTTPDAMPDSLKDARQGAILSQAGPLTETFGQIQPGVEVFSGGVTNGTGIGVPTGTRLALPPGKWDVVSSYAGGRGHGIGTNINSGWGNSVLAKNSQTGEMLRLSHLSQNYAKQGESITGGKVIGLTGDVGNTTGPHLNIEYYDKNGQIGNILQSPYAKYLPISQ